MKQVPMKTKGENMARQVELTSSTYHVYTKLVVPPRLPKHEYQRAEMLQETTQERKSIRQMEMTLGKNERQT
jgi:hypothetical protein